MARVVRLARKTPEVEPTMLSDDDLVKMIVYSPAGHGKTTLLGTGISDPRFSPMLIADFEGGLKSIRSRIRRVELSQLGTIQPQLDVADVVKIREYGNFDQLYDFLGNNTGTYRTIGIDSLSEVNYLNLQMNVGKAIEADSRHDPDVPYRDDYMRSISQMRKLIRFFRDLPYHVIFTCGAIEVEEPRTKLSQYRPSLTGRLISELPGLVDTIGYLAVVEDENGNSIRSLYVQPTEKFMAKDRSEGGKLGLCIDNPTLPRILDLMLAEPTTKEA